MKENRIEDRINNAYCFLNSMHSDFRTGLYYKEDLENLEHILSDYKRVLKELEEKTTILLAGAEKVKQLEKENEELNLKYHMLYTEKIDKQKAQEVKIKSQVIPVQKVKDNLIKYQEEYELLLEHQSGKESNRTKYLRGRIHMCQELLESEE